MQGNDVEGSNLEGNDVEDNAAEGDATTATLHKDRSVITLGGTLNIKHAIVPFMLASSRAVDTLTALECD